MWSLFILGILLGIYSKFESINLVIIQQHKNQIQLTPAQSLKALIFQGFFFFSAAKHPPDVSHYPLLIPLEKTSIR